jgi:nickel-dependent lactate racemase
MCDCVRVWCVCVFVLLVWSGRLVWWAVCGSICFRDQLEIVKFLHTDENPILGLNVVIDDQRRLGFASYGSIVASHAQAVDFVRSFAEVGVEGPKFGTVLTSSAGYPLDKTYYQTVKGMCLALGVLAPGGDLIIVSENSEGLGSEEFRDSQQNLAKMGSEKFLEMVLAKSHADIDEWETEMLLRAERASSGNIFMWSPGLSAEDRALTCCNMIDDSVDAAVERSLKKQASAGGGASSRGRVAVIPEVRTLAPVKRHCSLGGMLCSWCQCGAMQPSLWNDEILTECGTVVA